MSTTKQTIEGYAREAYVALKSTLKKDHQHKAKFLLFGRGRSGSTLLTSILNSSPLIFCDKEILNRPVLRPTAFIKQRASLFNEDIYGFKLLSYQLRSVQNRINEPKEFLVNLVKNEGYQMIFMSSSNLLRQTLSKFYANHRNVWHQQKSMESRSKMTIDVKALHKSLDEGAALGNFEKEVIDGLNYLDISYETDLSNTERQLETIKKISTFLQIPEFAPKIELKKITTEKFSGFIENYEEMAKYLSKTPYAKFLSDSE